MKILKRLATLLLATSLVFAVSSCGGGDDDDDDEGGGSQGEQQEGGGSQGSYVPLDKTLTYTATDADVDGSSATMHNDAGYAIFKIDLGKDYDLSNSFVTVEVTGKSAAAKGTDTDTAKYKEGIVAIFADSTAAKAEAEALTLGWFSTTENEKKSTGKSLLSGTNIDLTKVRWLYIKNIQLAQNPTTNWSVVSGTPVDFTLAGVKVTSEEKPAKKTGWQELTLKADAYQHGEENAKQDGVGIVHASDKDHPAEWYCIDFGITNPWATCNVEGWDWTKFATTIPSMTGAKVEFEISGMSADSKSKVQMIFDMLNGGGTKKSQVVEVNKDGKYTVEISDAIKDPNSMNDETLKFDFKPAATPDWANNQNLNWYVKTINDGAASADDNNWVDADKVKDKVLIKNVKAWYRED